MVESHAVLGVVSVALAMVLSPGPNMMYLVSRRVSQGRRAGMLSLSGVVAGFLAYLTAANLGLAVLLAAVPQILAAIRLAGAGYLLWLAWRTIRPGGASVFALREVPDDSPLRLFTMGLTTNLLNPKIAILYVSVIPQFVDPGAGHVLSQGVLLGLVQIAVASTVNLAIVLAAGGVAGFLARRPGWLRAQRITMGSVLGALAVTLALGG